MAQNKREGEEVVVFLTFFFLGLTLLIGGYLEISRGVPLEGIGAIAVGTGMLIVGIGGVISGLCFRPQDGD